MNVVIKSEEPVQPILRVHVGYDEYGDVSLYYNNIQVAVIGNKAGNLVPVYKEEEARLALEHIGVKFRNNHVDFFGDY